MSTDIAIWVGEPTGAEARRTFDSLVATHLAVASPTDAHPDLLVFADALTAIWPDLGEGNDDDESPWADGPLRRNVTGPLLYISMVSAHADEVIPFMIKLSQARGFVCFDPQSDRVLSNIER